MEYTFRWKLPQPCHSEFIHGVYRHSEWDDTQICHREER